jgi:hypothetical protein
MGGYKMENNKNKESNFVSDVFPAELEEIKARRKNVGIATDKLEGSPSTNMELTGLAISGGGIRSATFALGVVQELARRGLLKSTDYMSTVSGGGYTGSCISSLLNQPNDKLSSEDFPLQYTSGAAEPAALTHLRNSSNYLTPGGLLNQLRLPNILLRGIILNLFVFMPFIMAAVFFTEVSYELGPRWNDLVVWVLPIITVFVLMTILFPLVVRIMRQFFDWKKRNWFELWLTIPLLLVLVILFLIPILELINSAIEHNTEQALDWANNLFASQTKWMIAVYFVAIVSIFMLAGKASSNAARWSGKLLFILIGLIGPTLIFGIYLMLCLWQIDSPYLPLSSAEQLNKAIRCEQPCLTSSIAEGDEFASLARELEGRSIKLGSHSIVKCQSGDCKSEISAEDWEKDNRVWVINTAPQLQESCPPLKDIGPFENAGIVGNCHYIERFSATKLVIEGNQLHLLQSKEDYIFLGLLITLLVFNRFFLDMNITSLHGFYRDRLSKAYLFRLDDDNQVIHDDKIKLSSLNSAGSTAPYQLLNVALNLQASKAADLRGRKSDFFLLSKRYIGSDRTGFTETTKMEEYDTHMDLATAMAISAAAAAPNMGSATNRSLVFIMTLLNIRLGYWLPNPRKVNADRWYNRFTLKGAKPTLIWREALGKLDSLGSHVNVSDGGHIENLSIYPLLKRKCKYIVAIDGEADPKMTFSGLVKLMRFARIDMGIEIDLDLEPLRINEKGNSKSHWVMGNIRYGDGEIGKLLYIKLSVIGDEPEYIRAYRTDNPKYPHEPTSDQFFAEDQFEAYRALGEYACKNMLSSEQVLKEYQDILDHKDGGQMV